MPFIVPVLAAIGGGSAVAGGLAVAGTAASAYGAIKSANAASNAAKQAGQAGQIDIDALDQKARDIAQKNAADSAALEKALTPEIPELRSASAKSLLSQLGPNASESAATSSLLANLGKPVSGQLSTPLLQAAIAKAKADLELGGNLPVDVQNAVTRRSLANSANVGGGGLGLGRDVAARDLGLTSLDLMNQRLQTASQIGGQELQLASDNSNIDFNNQANLLNQLQLLRSINSDQFGRSLGAAQFAQSIAPPVVGLDPGSVADITIGNANNRSGAYASQANISGQQSSNYANLAGQLLGYGLLGAGNKTTTPTVAKTTTNPYPLLSSAQFLKGSKAFTY